MRSPFALCPRLMTDPHPALMGVRGDEARGMLWGMLRWVGGHVTLVCHKAKAST